MTRICQVSSVHTTFDTRIFYKICQSLVKKFEVYYVSANAKTEEVSGVKIVGVELPQSRIKRSFKLGKVYQKLCEIDAEIYHFHDPELIRIGLKMKRLGKKVIFDSHEDIPQQLLWKEYIPGFLKKIVSKIYEKYEKRALCKYDALISVTPTIVERLSKINSNTVMITNYPVFRELDGVNMHTGGGYNICFAGGVSQQYMHENIVESLPLTLANYLLAGPAYPGYLSRLECKKGWKQVQYLGVLKQDEVYDLYNKSVAGLVLLGYSPNVGYHKGTLGVLKMFEYMMAGIPVIATDFDLWKEIIDSEQCGKCINPYDVSAIADAINYYLNNPDEAKKQGLNGKKAVKEKYNWETQEAVLFDLYNSLIE